MGILTAFDDMEPNKIHVMGSADDETGVDEKANITMVFSNGRFGVAKTSVLAEVLWLAFTYLQLFSAR